jgi:disulfide bond formation protein DsbB
MILHPELADFLNYYLSIATLVFAVILFAWAIDLFIIRLKYGPYKELRSIYKKIAKYTLPLGFFASLSAVFLTLFYSEYLGYAPCALCWFQRVAMYPLVLLFAVAWLRKDFTVYRYVMSLSIVGFVIALYHQYLQMGYDAFIPCAASAVFVDCAKPSFVEFGFVTFPFMSLTLFSFFILLSLTLRMKVKRGE